MATHISINNVNFNCTSCKVKYPEARRISMKGCSGPIPNPVAKWKDRIYYYKCPSNFYSPAIAEIMTHARHIENGLLPYQGGLFDQPAKLVEVYNLANSLRLEDEITRLKKEAQEAKKWRKTK